MNEDFGRTLAAFMIDMYLSIKKTFSVDDYRHYSFTPKSLFEIYKNLPKYEFTDQEGLLEVIAN